MSDCWLSDEDLAKNLRILARTAREQRPADDVTPGNLEAAAARIDELHRLLAAHVERDARRNQDIGDLVLLLREALPSIEVHRRWMSHTTPSEERRLQAFHDSVERAISRIRT